MSCHSCAKIVGKDYDARKVVCGCCREVLKVDIVDLLLGIVPVYLTERNRNKKGRPCKLSYSERSRIKYMYNVLGNGATSIAKEFNVSRSTIYRIVHDKSVG